MSKTMYMSKLKLSTTAFIFCFVYMISISFGQVAEKNSINIKDSLSLEEFINEVVKSHPTVKSAEEEINSAETKISLAKTGYYPLVGINAAYNRLDPVSEITIPGLGTFQFYPFNNYNAALEFKQTIYDFGKTSNSVNKETENRELVKILFEQAKQKLSITAIVNFFSLIYLQEAINIKDEELKTLNEHLQYVEKKKELGTAIQYEILTTQVKISGIENQKTDISAAQKSQLSIFNSLLGKPNNQTRHLKSDLNNILFSFMSDSLLPIAFTQRNELKIAKEKKLISDLNYRFIAAQDNPVISVFSSAGWKNGYAPDLAKMTANYVAGVSLSIPLFDANKTKNNLLLAESSIKESDFDIDIAQRNITNEVVESEANVNAAAKKIEQFKLQLKQAQHAYSLAEINYKTGAITNLDLLDASTTVSESSLLLLKSKIDYIINVYKLKMAIGEKLY
jgi:outer membrane protein